MCGVVVRVLPIIEVHSPVCVSWLAAVKRGHRMWWLSPVIVDMAAFVESVPDVVARGKLRHSGCTVPCVLPCVRGQSSNCVRSHGLPCRATVANAKVKHEEWMCHSCAFVESVPDIAARG